MRARVRSEGGKANIEKENNPDLSHTQTHARTHTYSCVGTINIYSSCFGRQDPKRGKKSKAAFFQPFSSSLPDSEYSPVYLHRCTRGFYALYMTARVLYKKLCGQRIGKKRRRFA